MEIARLFVRALGEPAFYLLLFDAALDMLIPYWAQRELLARMDEERRARAWNALSWAVALLWVGPFSMLPFAWITRRERGSWEAARAILWGVFLSVLFFGVSYLKSAAIEWVGLAPGRGP